MNSTLALLNLSCRTSDRSDSIRWLASMLVGLVLGVVVVESRGRLLYSSGLVAPE